MIFNLVLLVIFLIIHKSSLILTTLITIIFNLIYIKENNKKRFELNTLLFIINLLNSILSFKNPNGFIIILPIITSFVIYVVFLNSETNKKWKELNISDFFEKIFGKDDIEITDDDVKICNNLETGKPVYLHAKDRFLHMLILGPTGSGKTSQVIIPMISQDMKNFNAGITVLEPKGDLADKVYAMALRQNRKCFYFNPSLKGCPTFNPLQGNENDVIETITTTFKMLNPTSPQYFLDVSEVLLRNAVMVCKRLKKDGTHPTLIELNDILTNPSGIGSKMVLKFGQIVDNNPLINKQNQDISQYFLQDYYAERSKTYEHASGIRTQLAKLISNLRLREILNPENGVGDINFDDCLENGKVVSMTTSQGEFGDLSKFLGYFLILNFQAAVFRRPGNENTRRNHYFYIDEFQTYTNPSFANMLTQGRSYRVASHLGTQNRSLIGMGFGTTGKDFTELVSTNARNMIIFPGANVNDAKYYSEQFGEILKKEIRKGKSVAKFNPLYGMQQIKYPTVSEQITEKEVARFSPSDIIYRNFGEITYSLIQNNTVQTPNVGKIEYIDKNENELLDKIILENIAIMKSGEKPEKYRDEKGLLYPHVKIEDFDNFIKNKKEEKQLMLTSYGNEIKNEETSISLDTENIENEEYESDFESALNNYESAEEDVINIIKDDNDDIKKIEALDQLVNI